jgi:hypothetical protein
MLAPTKRFNLLLSAGLALLGFTVVLFGARTVADATDSPLAISRTGLDSAAPTEASLHNPTFDNQIWYEFKLRYQSAYPFGSWLPDDDTPGGPQDWRLWFLDGTAIIESDPEKTFAHLGSNRGVQMRPYDWGKENHQVAGLYQVVYDATPCLVYEFQMYGQSRPEDEYRDAVLKVGIDQVGWHPDSKQDPAVHGDFPSTTVWGPSHDYKFTYNPLTVTAEALNSQITVFTYADAPGGRFHRVLWDTGSFQDVTPEMIHDPYNLPFPSGIFSLSESVGRTSATINWTTANEALGQVYYRLLSSEVTSHTYTNTVYLPMVISSGSHMVWQATPLERPPTTTHSQSLSNLEPGSSYEYIVVSRGLSGGQCVTWVSEKQTLTTDE